MVGLCLNRGGVGIFLGLARVLFQSCFSRASLGGGVPLKPHQTCKPFYRNSVKQSIKKAQKKNLYARQGAFVGKPPVLADFGILFVCNAFPLPPQILH